MANAKRYGIEVQDDIELENRIRRIEIALEKFISANDLDSEGGGGTTRTNDIPQVTGFRVVGSTPGAITLGWNAVPISDLRRYELDIAENPGFTTNKQTFFVAGTQFQFSTASSTGGGGGTVIYARVRAANRAGRTGPYSVTLNTSTGQAQTADIGEQAVGEEQIDDVVIEGLTITVSDDVHTFTPVTRLNFNPNHFYLAGDNSLGDDPIVNLNLGLHKTSSGLMTVPTSSGVASFAHGQNGRPDFIHAFFVNMVAQGNYAPGDYVPATSDAFGSLNIGQPSYAAWFNATHAGVGVDDEVGGDTNDGIFIPDRDGGGTIKLIRSRWRILIDTYKIV